MKDDKYLHSEKEIEEHSERDQDAEEQEERGNQILPHQDVGEAQSGNTGGDPRIKKEKTKKKLMNLAYWSMIVLVILTCCYVVFYLSGNAHQCLADPLKYYQEKIGQTCYCMNIP